MAKLICGLVFFGFSGLLVNAVDLKRDNSECFGQGINCPLVDGHDPVYIAVANCSRFCECSNGVPYIFDCPGTLHFNPTLNVCDWPETAGCAKQNNDNENNNDDTDTPDKCAHVPCTPECAEHTYPLENCSEYCKCTNGILTHEVCPSHLHWNNKIQQCDLPQFANCNNPDDNSDDECTEAKEQCPAVDGPDSVYLPLPDCTKFCQCSNGKPHLHNCPDGLHFNPTLNVCDWPQDAGCDGNATTTTPSPPAPQPTTPSGNNGDDDCAEAKGVCPAVDGPDSVYLPLPDCTKFCQCSNGKAHLHNCPDGLHFNPTLNVCDWPQDAGCDGNATTTTPSPPAPQPTTPSGNNGDDDCAEAKGVCPAVDGPDSVYLPLPDCTKFCQCSNGKAHLHNCPDGLHFNPTLNVCDWPQDAGCEGNATTTTPSPPAPQPTTPSGNNGDDDCAEAKGVCPAVDGPDSVYLPLPDCTKFCQCSNGKPHLHNCPDGLHFNPTLNVCDWPQDAGCKGNATTTTPSPPAPQPTTPSGNNGDDDCAEAKGVCPVIDGPDSVYLPLPDCTKFCQCSNGKPHLHNCPDGLHFNPTLNVCDWPQDAGCDGNATTTTPSPPAPQPTTPSGNNSDDECAEAKDVCPAVDGPDSVYLPLPDCTKFCQCSNGKPHLHNCPDGLHFNPTLNVCDWPQDAGCEGNSTTTTPSPPAPQPTTPSGNNGDDDCAEAKGVCPAVDGPDSVYLPLPDCTKFCQCSNGKPHLHNCPDGLHFNPTLNVCDWPQDAGCEGNSTTTTPSPPAPQPTTPSGNNGDDDCAEAKGVCPAVDGPDSVYLPLPDCTKFCQCSNGKPHLHNCPDGLHFNPTLNVCDWPQDAGCEGNSTTTTPSPPAPQPTTPSGNNGDDDCAEAKGVCPAVDGPDSVYLPLPDCTKFCQCSNGKPHLHNCPDGLHFNPTLNVCDWPQDAGCDGNATTTTPSPPAPQPTTPSGNNSDDECAEAKDVCPAVDGPDSVYLPLPDCTKFCQCSNGKPHLHNCPDGLHFNPTLNVCDWPQDAGCEGNSTTTTPSPPAPQPTTPSGNNGDDDCAEAKGVCPAVDGPDSVYLPLPDCTKFCQCSNGKPHLHNCPDGLHFNPTLNVCDWPQDAGCEGNSTTTTPSPPAPQPTTPSGNNGDDDCAEAKGVCPAVDGPDSVYLPLPDCTKFCQCSNGKPHLHNCPDGLHFNPTLNVCDWPQDAGCEGNSTTTTPSPPAPQPTTPSGNNGDDDCAEAKGVCPAVDGPDSVYLPLPDCTKFCQCSNGKPHLHNCPDGLHFNPTLNVCDWPQDAGCEGNATTTTPSPPAPQPTTPSGNNGDDDCADAKGVCPAVDGPDSVYLPLPDCTKFCQCSNGKPHLHNCPDGLHFNPNLNVCDWPQDAGCEGNATTTTPSPPAPQPTTPSGNNGEDDCAEAKGVCPAVDGPDSVYLPLPDCTKFCQCSNGKPHLHNCPDGLHFNPTLNVCDWPQDAGCEGNATTTTPSPPAPQPTTPSGNNGDDDCAEAKGVCPAVDDPDSVYLPLPDCTKFCQCSNGKPHLHNCPDGLHFNPNLNVCDWPQDAGCEGNATTTTPSPPVPQPTTPSGNNGEDDCAEAKGVCPAVDGPDSVYLPLPDCTKFCQCSNGKPHLHNCPDGLHFNPTLNVCDWPQNAGCGGNATTTTPSPPAPQPTTPSGNNGDDDCAEAKGVCPVVDGPDSVYLPLPDCTKFCQCSNGKPHLHNCPDGLHFNPTLNVCDWPQDAGCDGNANTTTPSSPAPQPTTPSGNNGDDDCADAKGVCPAVDGPDSVYLPLPDCTKFCQCSNGKPHLHNCPDGLHFNPTLNVCDWPQDAGCEGNATTTTPSPPAPQPTTPSGNNGDDDCADAKGVCPAVDGPDSVYLPLPDCTKFCQCSNGKPHLHNCPDGLHFNPNLNVCDWPQDAGCEGNATTTTPSPPAPQPTTPSGNNGEDDCAEAKGVCPAVDGPDSVYLPLPDCTKFCQCSNGKPHLHNCPDGLHFNPTLNVCDWPQDAGCEGNATTTTPSPPAPQPTTPSGNNGDDDCAEAKGVCPAVDGPDSVYLPLPDCTKFCQCSNGKPHLHNCPDGLQFNPNLNVCDWPQDAGCEGNATTTTPSPPAPQPTTPSGNNGDDDCADAKGVCPAVDGPDSVYLPLPDCTKFCQCSNGKPYLHNCPSGLHFNPVLNVCDWPLNAKCQ